MTTAAPINNKLAQFLREGRIGKRSPPICNSTHATSDSIVINKFVFMKFTH
jgi:hypothetical protein